MRSDGPLESVLHAAVSRAANDAATFAHETQLASVPRRGTSAGRMKIDLAIVSGRVGGLGVG